MTAYSLRARLLALWVLLLASAIATAYLMFGVYAQSTGVQVAQTYITVGRACREIIDRYTARVGLRGAVAETDLAGVVEAALAGAGAGRQRPLEIRVAGEVRGVERP